MKNKIKKNTSKPEAKTDPIAINDLKDDKLTKVLRNKKLQE